MIDDASRWLIMQGALGVACLFLVLALKRKDDALGAEVKARVEDAKAYAAAIVNVNREVSDAVRKMAELVSSWERREQEREIREARISRHER